MKDRLLLFSSILLFSLFASATKTDLTKKKQKAKTSVTRSVPRSQEGSQLSTDVKFDDHLVGGKYQVPLEALSVVENEKILDELIGVRKDFNDRVEKSKGLR